MPGKHRIVTIFVCEKNKYVQVCSFLLFCMYLTAHETNFIINHRSMDIIATKCAAEYTRKQAVDDTEGPVILEYITYHYGGHWYVFLSYFISFTQNANDQLLRTAHFNYQLLSTGQSDPLEQA